MMNFSISPEGTRYREFRTSLSSLVSLSETASKKAPSSDQSGRRKKIAKKMYIIGLAFLYFGFTGKIPGLGRDGMLDGQPSGPFFRFVDACFRHIKHPQGPETLAGPIREISSWYKNLPTDDSE